MDVLEAILAIARQGAPYFLLLISALCAAVAFMNGLATQRRRQWEDDADCIYPDWQKLYEAPETSPEPGFFNCERTASRVTYGLAAVILGGEALFVMHLQGWI